MKGFIKLNATNGEYRLQISCIAGYWGIDNADYTEHKASITVNNTEIWVKETPEEIDKLIEEALK